MKQSTNLIYYPAGCYGTFVDWSCRFFTIGNDDTTFPFNPNGNSHQILDFENFFFPETLDKLIASDHPYVRIHPAIFEETNTHNITNNSTWYDIVNKDLDYLSMYFRKILVIHPDDSTRLWHNDNEVIKTTTTEEQFNKFFKPLGYTKDFSMIKALLTSDIDLKYKYHLEEELKIENIQQWNKNLLDFDPWELREILSLYWFNRDSIALTPWNDIQNNFPDIKFISISDLKINFQKTIANYLDFFKVNVNKSKFKQYITSLEHSWRQCQFYINNDTLTKDIVSSIIKKENFDWDNTNLTIIDEAYIQKTLSDAGIQIKCCNLNKFPSNTKDFLKLLEY